MRVGRNCTVGLRWLLLAPLFVYAVSYLYLAYYHGRWFIAGTVVHESGKYTLLEVVFYASHFLGHIPVLVFLAFLFVGSFFCLSGFDGAGLSKKEAMGVVFALILLLAGSIIASLAVFGREDTLGFVLQKKQGVGMYAEGGAWNLHMPSSMLLFFFTPVYLFALAKIFGGRISPDVRGLRYLLCGLLCFLVFTLAFNCDVRRAFVTAWTNPRYLAHSVRELATFPVTYFPIPLYFMLRKKNVARELRKSRAGAKAKVAVGVCAVLFVSGFCYQCYVPLSEGIGNLAQKPAFAKGDTLGVPYLLASHYFEHFSDTVFFALACILLYSLGCRNKADGAA